MADYMLAFDAAGGDDATRVGGKGVNLSRLTRAGFPVPPGFTVTTDAYSAFVDANGLWPKIEMILSSIDYENADDQEEKASRIRALIAEAPMPESIAGEIAKSYAEFGGDPYVAVRSSGTAEDLAGASFAGQHDTYLDIRGSEDVLDAVKRCWASLWTTRAVAYRQRGGFDDGKVRIAVVIQKMIESEVSGVMFTANPMTAAVDEYVVNASYGLGEAIVAGIVTPDLFRLNRDDGLVRETVLGSKALKIVRAADCRGTVEAHVPDADRERPCLDNDQLEELAALGSRVMEYYEGYPQDIEWAFADGQFYLLQSRDVTGVEFSWDEDLDNFQKLPKVDDTIWTRAWSDGVWTGAITPFMYSFRCENGQINRSHFSKIWNIDWGGERRVYKYHKAFVYYNCMTDYTGLTGMIAPSMRREELFEHLPPAWRKKILDEPFSWTKFIAMWGRIALLDSRHLPWKCWDHNYKLIEAEFESAHGLSQEKIRRMSDRALKAYTLDRIWAEPEYFQHYLGLFYLHVPIAMGYMHKVVEKWLGSEDPSMVSELLTGSPYESITVRENRRLQELAEIIGNTPKLKALFDNHPGKAFFEEAKKIPEGKAFTEKYALFIKDYGHRGHADRDIWFERRAENPALDYAALQPIIGVDFSEGEAKAKAVAQHRQELTAEVIAKLKAMPFGDLRAQAFLYLQDWLLRFWAFRDDERAHADKITFSIKKAVAEVGRRLYERGLIDRPDDYYFLSKLELFELFDRDKTNRLAREKINARRRNHERFKVEFYAPMYMIGDQYADLDVEEESDNPNVLKGTGTSKGKYTGRARIIASQKDIGQVKKGEILITAATDPGWTPVFMVISGLVLETGGMLAHGALISREYGIPAVQVNNAMKRIPDGALITVDGNTGQVIIEDEGGEGDGVGADEKQAA